MWNVEWRTHTGDASAASNLDNRIYLCFVMYGMSREEYSCRQNEQCVHSTGISSDGDPTYCLAVTVCWIFEHKMLNVKWSDGQVD